MGDSTKPYPLTPAEWEEVIQVPQVRIDWGFESSDMTAAEFADQVYAVKFKFVPMTGPGYVGDLFILHGDALGEPLVLVRGKDGGLVMP